MANLPLATPNLTSTQFIIVMRQSRRGRCATTNSAKMELSTSKITLTRAFTPTPIIGFLEAQQGYQTTSSRCLLQHGFEDDHCDYYQYSLTAWHVVRSLLVARP